MRLVRAADLEEAFFEYKELEEIAAVREIIRSVRRHGDEAVKRYTREFDGVILEELKVGALEVEEAYGRVDERIVSSIGHAADNIRKFAERQLDQFEDFQCQIAPGVIARQKVSPIERVGLYVPGGRFPLVSTLLMGAVPARVAGVREVIVCSPPSYNGSIHPAILVAADMVGVDEIFRVGGAQAIAAMAYGTQTIKKVDKIVGPGNKYVAWAKREVWGSVGIDFLAGPTEIMIIADETADPKVVAADLLAQAEHDVEAVPLLVTPSAGLAKEVSEEIERQLGELMTGDIARASIEKNGMIILVDDMREAVHVANAKAPEHLALQVRNPQDHIGELRNYGSLFVGRYSAEVLGDYSAGINHTLPTNGGARYAAGLSVRDFIRLQTILEVTKEGVMTIGPVAEALAEAEGLDGHARSIAMRMQ